MNELSALNKIFSLKSLEPKKKRIWNTKKKPFQVIFCCKVGKDFARNRLFLKTSTLTYHLKCYFFQLWRKKSEEKTFAEWSRCFSIALNDEIFYYHHCDLQRSWLCWCAVIFNHRCSGRKIRLCWFEARFTFLRSINFTLTLWNCRNPFSLFFSV